MAADLQNQNRELSQTNPRPKDSGMEADEQYLLRAFQRGNLDAFGILVHRYQDRLYTSLVRFLDNQEDAQDVMQETFLSAFANARRFKGQSRFYTWIYRIAMNHAIDLHRRNKPRQTLSIYQVNQEEPADPNEAEGPQQTLIREEDRQWLRTALKSLSDEHRMVIVMKEIDDMRYEEIAEVLEVPVGTVRSRLHRARLELKDALEQSQKQ